MNKDIQKRDSFAAICYLECFWKL